jgi:hypothetical protein
MKDFFKKNFIPSHAKACGGRNAKAIRQICSAISLQCALSLCALRHILLRIAKKALSLPRLTAEADEV